MQDFFRKLGNRMYSVCELSAKLGQDARSKRAYRCSLDLKNIAVLGADGPRAAGLYPRECRGERDWLEVARRVLQHHGFALDTEGRIVEALKRAG